MKINLDMRTAKADVKEFIRMHNVSRRELQRARKDADNGHGASFAEGASKVDRKYYIYHSYTQFLIFLMKMGIVKNEIIMLQDYRYEKFPF